MPPLPDMSGYFWAGLASGLNPWINKIAELAVNKVATVRKMDAILNAIKEIEQQGNLSPESATKLMSNGIELSDFLDVYTNFKYGLKAREIDILSNAWQKISNMSIVTRDIPPEALQKLAQFLTQEFWFPQTSQATTQQKSPNNVGELIQDTMGGTATPATPSIPIVETPPSILEAIRDVHEALYKSKEPERELQRMQIEEARIRLSYLEPTLKLNALNEAMNTLNSIQKAYSEYVNNALLAGAEFLPFSEFVKQHPVFSSQFENTRSIMALLGIQLPDVDNLGKIYDEKTRVAMIETALREREAKDLERQLNTLQKLYEIERIATNIKSQNEETRLRAQEQALRVINTYTNLRKDMYQLFLSRGVPLTNEELDYIIFDVLKFNPKINEIAAYLGASEESSAKTPAPKDEVARSVREKATKLAEKPSATQEARAQDRFQKYLEGFKGEGGTYIPGGLNYLTGFAGNELANFDAFLRNWLNFVAMSENEDTRRREIRTAINFLNTLAPRWKEGFPYRYDPATGRFIELSPEDVPQYSFNFEEFLKTIADENLKNILREEVATATKDYVQRMNALKDNIRMFPNVYDEQRVAAEVDEILKEASERRTKGEISEDEWSTLIELARQIGLLLRERK
jgi:hypothetical protein